MYIVSVSGRRFGVREDEIDRIRGQLADAARSGGTFVSFDVRGVPVEVLVTPGLPVVIEQVPDVHIDDEPEVAAGASTAGSLVAATDEFDDWGI